MRTLRHHAAASFALLSLLVATSAARGQTVVQPGFNLFTVDQDAEIGRQSAVEVERQLPMLSEPALSRYVAVLAARLATNAPGAMYPYQIKVANLSDVNAFALPGGFIYVDRGLLETVRTEGELAGVIAHEIAHVALRHATNQVSKAYLAQEGIGLLGGLSDENTQTTTGEIVGAVGGFGLNALFLEYSRGAEAQADIVGAQIMAKAGYDPMEMVRFFETLRKQAGSPMRGAKFLSDHPAPADQEAIVRQEVALLSPVRPASPVGDIAALQSLLAMSPPAQAIARVAASKNVPAAPRARSVAPTATVSVEPPSTRFRTFRQSQGYFEIQYPENWSAYAPSRGYGLTVIAPGGFVPTPGGRQSLACGIVVNHYTPFDGEVGTQYRDPQGSLFGHDPLEEAMSDLVRQILRVNPHLKVAPDSERHDAIAGSPALSVYLSGRSPATGARERVTVVTRRLPDLHVVYMVLVVPEKDRELLAASSERMVRSLRVNVRVDRP